MSQPCAASPGCARPQDIAQPVARDAVFEADCEITRSLFLERGVPVANHRQLSRRHIDDLEPFALQHPSRRACFPVTFENAGARHRVEVEERFGILLAVDEGVVVESRRHEQAVAGWGTEPIELEAVGLRSYVAEPDRGRRDWSQEPAARTLVYANRRRIRGARGRRLMRQRVERVERSFAHLYDTGGMRRTHLRGHTNILKRQLIHAGGFNLGLVMRRLIGSGTPRGLQDRPRRPSSPRFGCSWALPDAGWSRFPHGTHS